VEVGATPEVFSDVADIPTKRIRLHSVRFCYVVEIVAGTLRDEIDGSTDHVEWVQLDHALTLPPIAPFVTEVLQGAAATQAARP
jgi:hypothetical protein